MIQRHLRALLFIGAWVLAAAGPAPPVFGAAPTVRWLLGPRDLAALHVLPGGLDHVIMANDGNRLFLVERRPPDHVRLLVLEVSAHRAIRNYHLNVGQVDALASNADGSRLFIVSGLGSQAAWFDVDSGRVAAVYRTTPGRGFHFALPIKVIVRPDGRAWCRGYSLNAQGESTGNVMAVFDAAGHLTTRVDVAALESDSGAVGNLPELAFNGDASTLAFISKQTASVDRLFVRVGGGKPRLVKAAPHIRGLGVSRDGSRLFYDLDREPGGALVMAALPGGAPRKVWRGDFAVPLVSADGRTVLTARLVYRHPPVEALMYATQGGGWKMTPLRVPGWSKRQEIYALSADGRSFLLWASDALLVGRMP